MSTEPISSFFDREAEACCREDPEMSDGVAGVSSVVLEQLERAGIEGRSVLDLGCGTGALVVEAVRRGAASGTGVDVSPKSIQAARLRARSAGLEGRVAFEVGDASKAEPGPHDVVVLNKSICCFPDPDRLVGASIAATERVYAFSVPASGGLRGVTARVTVFLENAWRRLRGDPFRAFVHPTRRIEERVRGAGLERVALVRWWTWIVAVYARPAA